MISTRNEGSFTTKEVFIGYQLQRDQATGIFDQRPLYRRFIVDAVREPEAIPFPADFVKSATIPHQPEPAKVEELITDPIAEPECEEAINPQSVVFDFMNSAEGPCESEPAPEELEADQEETKAEPEKKPIVKRKVRKATAKKKPAKKGKANGKEYTGKPRGRKKATDTEAA